MRTFSWRLNERIIICSARGTTARGGLVFRHADDHGPDREVPGIPDQAMPGTLAGKGSRACRPYGETHHPTGDKGPRRSNRYWAACAEAGRRTARHGRRSGPNWVKAYREGGMTALRPKNRNAGQADKPAVRRDRNAGDAEAPRRRVEEPELENAVMREVAEVVRKRPGRRPAAPVEQGEDASVRPSEADVFAQLDDMLARHRTGRPPTATTPGSPLTDTPGCVSGWPGRSPLPRAGTGAAGSRPRSEPASRRRCSAGSWPRGWSDGACSRTTRVRLIRGARPRRLTATSPTAISRLGCRTGNGQRTSPGSRPGTGRACLSPPVDCYDGRIVAYTAGSGPNAELADRMLVKAAETLPEGARPLAHSDRGCHCRWSGWLALMDRYGLTRSTGAKDRSPDNGRGGVLRTHEDGIRPSRALGGSYPRRGARPGRRLHPPVRPRAHQTVAWLDESGTLPSEPGNGCVIISKKTSAAPYLMICHSNSSQNDSI